MHSKTASTVMMSLLVLSTLTLAFRIQMVRADGGTVTINADGSVTPSNAPIVTTDNVTYTLTGNISSSSDGIVVDRNNIVLDGVGFAVQGNGSGDGVDLRVSNVTVKNMNIEGYGIGIDVEGTLNSISGNYITKNGYGMFLYGSYKNYVSGNKFTSNGYSMYFDYSDGDRISGNNFTNNGDGIYFSEFAADLTVSGNQITNDGDGIYFYRSYDDYVSGNTFANNEHGIYGASLSNTGISDNSITNNTYGIDITTSAYFTELSNNDWFSRNTIANNSFGIVLAPSNYDSVYGNTIASNGVGVSVATSNQDKIHGNNIGANSNYGLELSSCLDCSVYGNNFTSNGEGVLFQSSSDNNVFYCCFVNNTVQANVTGGSTNVWDDGYPAGGNYWSDYHGSDSFSGVYQNLTGSDGIGDAPYVIDVNNTDSYPLMLAPKALPQLIGDLNGDGIVNQQDLVLLAKAYGSKIGDANWNPKADLAPPFGIIGLSDLVTLVTHYGNHYP